MTTDATKVRVFLEALRRWRDLAGQHCDIPIDRAEAHQLLAAAADVPAWLVDTLDGKAPPEPVVGEGFAIRGGTGSTTPPGAPYGEGKGDA